MKIKRAAVIGLGDIAPTHIAVLKELNNVELTAVCDADPAKGCVAGGLPFYTDIQTLLSDAKPDVVHLCLPHHLHYPVAELAARAGVNVFCEKPLALDLEEARRFAALESSHPQLCFGLCLQNRLNNSTQALLRVIESGEVGSVTGIKAVVAWRRDIEYYRAAPWRGLLALSGGGVMNNQSVHTLDLMELFGGKIDTVRGSICKLLDYGIEVEDTATASIRFKNGAVGLFMATVANRRNDSVEIAVTMERGEYLIADGALWSIENGVRSQVCEDEHPSGGKRYYGNSHGRAIDQYYSSLVSGDSGYIHASEGVASMRLIDAIRRSSAAEQSERTIRL